MSVSGGPVAAKAEASTTIFTSAASFRLLAEWCVARLAHSKSGEQYERNSIGGVAKLQASDRWPSCPLEMPNFPGPGTALAFAADVFV